MSNKIKNIAIIAHVDHGKTTLVDAMLKQSGIFRDNQKIEERVMDSNDLEKERGITIFSKNASIFYKDYKINIVDTPGHADFGGEVQRILKMADNVLLLVDAFEGAMPQTKYVLKKALEHGHRPIVVINKIDRPNSRPDEVVDMVFDLFVELNANEYQLDFPIIYASAKNGFAKHNLDDPDENLIPLFDTILENVDDPEGDINAPFQFLITNIYYDNYLGKIGTGRIYNGSVKLGEEVVLLKRDGERLLYRISKLIGYEGLNQVELKEAFAGDIISIAGLEKVDVGETIASKENPIPLPLIEIDEPTLAMTFMVNDSPFVGQDGKFLTSRQILARLEKEVQTNVSMKLEMTDSPDAFIVKGRGELQLSILIENMRREGYELQVSKPQVIFKELEGQKTEPIELATIDVADEYVGTIIEKMGLRKGEMINMVQGNDGYTRLEFKIPARGLIGFRNEFLTDTKGTGVLNQSFYEYEFYKGDIPTRTRGVLVATEPGVSVAYALFNIQERGTLFIEPGVDIYEGMIVGEHSRENDLIVNACKGKKLTNMRAAGSDENVKLAPPRKFSLEQALEYIEDDELLEITPINIRMRKKILKAGERKRSKR
ncbi:GTP-binding protein [Hypnocyclicus thermotrophus]|uniref:Large ribosomal subunit assembly factor BipA n=1 Tax=Hypnocyclicus thermotrophus TaxID=1627895 RepID=A0AA46DYD3_9FUSO|nr:translational GTPase TypA [Hypnocyclicus thermotrophus]TDT69190.1 GTP-binding protein [Hypnocyclicus thermotrophus]